MQVIQKHWNYFLLTIINNKDFLNRAFFPRKKKFVWISFVELCGKWLEDKFLAFYEPNSTLQVCAELFFFNQNYVGEPKLNSLELKCQDHYKQPWQRLYKYQENFTEKNNKTRPFKRNPWQKYKSLPELYSVNDSRYYDVSETPIIPTSCTRKWQHCAIKHLTKSKPASIRINMSAHKCHYSCT